MATYFENQKNFIGKTVFSLGGMFSSWGAVEIFYWGIILPGTNNLFRAEFFDSV